MKVMPAGVRDPRLHQIVQLGPSAMVFAGTAALF